MRLAWFTPLAPVRSGIGSYSAMVLPALAARHDIAVFVGDDVWTAYAGDHLLVPPGRHDLHAEDYSVVLLTVATRGTSTT